MHKVVFIRHGESTWNKENRFTGWTDVPLSEKGRREAQNAGRLLFREGYKFDKAYVSVLTRALTTLNIVLEEMGLLWIPVEKSWRLNERHYGALQGLNKSETSRTHGEEKVKIWRRSYDVPPPKLSEESEYFPGNDARYRSVERKELPFAECLKDTVNRFVPYWKGVIAPSIASGERIVVAAHGNSLRAAVKYLDGISDDAIVALNIPTGVPLVYELDENLRPLKHYYLGDEEEIRKAAEAVAKQGKA